MNRRILPGRVLIPALLFSLAAGPDSAADTVAAERQYRIARRLAAESSSEAAEALRKVVELDPSGPFADDALVDLALLIPIPRWPEDLGRLAQDPAGDALGLLAQVVEAQARGDRAGEAQYRRALLRLEPLPGHDPSNARLDLIIVATSPDAGQWANAARYAVAWLDEQQGRVDRAHAGYQRLLVDAADSPAAQRAKVGLARVMMREGSAGQAARWLQEAVDSRVPADLSAEPQRERAVRYLLSASGLLSGGPPRMLAPSTGIRSVAGMAVLPDGGMLLGDRRTSKVTAFSTSGSTDGSWTLDDLQAVAVNALGRKFAAAGDRIYRLPPDAPPLPVASLGEFAQVSGLAVDGLGRCWVVNKRGDSIGRIDPGASSPIRVWQGRGNKLLGLEWDGTRLVTLSGRERKLRTLDAEGTLRPIGGHTFQKPTLLAVDPAGRLAVYDARTTSVVFLNSDGEATGTFPAGTAGVDRPVAMQFGLDGALHLFDAANGAWMRLP